MRNIEIDIDDDSLRKFLSLDVKKFGVQHSVKIANQLINPNRVLFGVQSHSISFSKLRDILRQMSFPDMNIYQVESLYYTSHEIGFGLEKHGDVLNYRMYFEKKYRYEDWAKLQERNPQLAPLFVAYKWDENSQSTIFTKYSAVNYKDKDDLIAKVGELSKFVPMQIIAEVNRSDNASFLLHAYDSSTPRNSYDLKFENSDFFMDSFDFSDIENFFEVKNLKDKLEKYKSLPINHVAGGIDKKGNPFFTLYFEEIIIEE